MLIDERNLRSLSERRCGAALQAGELAHRAAQPSTASVVLRDRHCV
jgi:hypothetical protein